MPELTWELDPRGGEYCWRSYDLYVDGQKDENYYVFSGSSYADDEWSPRVLLFGDYIGDRTDLETAKLKVETRWREDNDEPEPKPAAIPDGEAEPSPWAQLVGRNGAPVSIRKADVSFLEHWDHAPTCQVWLNNGRNFCVRGTYEEVCAKLDIPLPPPSE